jgi:hypothetical protein
MSKRMSLILSGVADQSRKQKIHQSAMSLRNGASSLDGPKMWIIHSLQYGSSKRYGSWGPRPASGVPSVGDNSITFLIKNV